MANENPVFEQIQGLLLQADSLLKECIASKPLHLIEADMLKEQLRDLYLKAQYASAAAQTEVARSQPAPAPIKDEKPTEAITPTFIATDETNEQAEPAEKADEPQPAVEQKVAEPQPAPAEETVAEPQPVIDETPAAEEHLFAPAEPEPEPMPTMEPMMEQIAGNPYGSLFDTETTEEEPTPEPAPEKDEKKASTPHASTEKSEPSLLDLLRQPSDQTTLGDRLSQQTDTSNAIEHRMAHNKVSDLRTVININDKFSFMTNLFRNNMKAYNDFILRLNAIESRDEAMEQVRLVSKEFGWDMESATVQNFYAVLDRKF